jgi:hypothetical protein
MNAKLKQVLERASTWPLAAQEELTRTAQEIDAEQHGVYEATDEELRDIDEALAEIERGEIATDDEVEAVFAKYRRA